MMFAPPSCTLLVLERAEAISSTNVASIPAVTDLVGYDAVMNSLRREGRDRMEGDLLEIGCFLGGGTAKLAQLAEIERVEIMKERWMLLVKKRSVLTNLTLKDSNQ